ncbi:MAG: type II toxin-antitoxin system HicB family antitoxin [Desulfotomaculum sp.]|nr:type II toxin-antitoxin system HicB family antitoxin [Desulfotomaculum sp.]
MENNLEYYLSLKYPFIIHEEEDGTHVIEYPDLPGCFSCGDTIAEVIKMGEDAKKGWFDIALQDGEEIPKPKEIERYSGQFRLRIPKTLHKDLSKQADKENISMNQYCLYLLAKEHQRAVDKR